MRFSLWTSTEPAWTDLLERARAAEAAGLDGVWVADHFMPNSDDVSAPMLECFSVLAALAAAVPRVRLGSLVAGNTYRHPAVLANVAAAIDQVSLFGTGDGAGDAPIRWQSVPAWSERQRLQEEKAALGRWSESCRMAGMAPSA